ncbi:hypothetical protein niasHT_002504 [Heterodera trifolii]|uniref:DUS-like FMN-binding domain-containing protein n=1 Tax=Heterodera trifolii TaxID=157864 RepID=A0ABD2M8J4_9BILA
MSNQQTTTDEGIGSTDKKQLGTAQQQLKQALEEITQLEEMRVINEEMLEEYKEQQKKVEEELNDQIDQQMIIVKQLEYQLEEKDRMVEKLEFALVKFREKIDELNEQLTRKQEELDNQMSAAEMIDRLTSKTLDLEEHKICFTLNEAIIEGKESTEKALKQQLDEQMIAISNLKHQISDWEDRAVYYEHFRRPLIVQFCANDPQTLLSVCRLVEGKCDGVDLNLGCLQLIAKKGRYGAFLQETPELIESMISAVHRHCHLPISAKIRVLHNLSSTIEYARRIEAAGARQC